MDIYSELSRDELIALLRQKDRQIEGERTNSRRVEAENQQLKEAIEKVKDVVANDVFAVLSHLPK